VLIVFKLAVMTQVFWPGYKNFRKNNFTPNIVLQSICFGEFLCVGDLVAKMSIS